MADDNDEPIEPVGPYVFAVAREQIATWAAECVELIRGKMQRGDPPDMLTVTMATATAMAIAEHHEAGADEIMVSVAALIVQKELRILRGDGK